MGGCLDDTSLPGILDSLIPEFLDSLVPVFLDSRIATWTQDGPNFGPRQMDQYIWEVLFCSITRFSPQMRGGVAQDVAQDGLRLPKMAHDGPR